MSGDGKKLVYMHQRTSRLQFMKYGEVLQNWINTDEAPILGGDDVSVNGDIQSCALELMGLEPSHRLTQMWEKESSQLTNPTVHTGWFMENH